MVSNLDSQQQNNTIDLIQYLNMGGNHMHLCSVAACYSELLSVMKDIPMKEDQINAEIADKE